MRVHFLAGSTVPLFFVCKQQEERFAKRKEDGEGSRSGIFAADTSSFLCLAHKMLFAKNKRKRIRTQKKVFYYVVF